MSYSPISQLERLTITQPMLWHCIVKFMAKPFSIMTNTTGRGVAANTAILLLLLQPITRSYHITTSLSLKYLSPSARTVRLSK